ncbi:MAG: N-acetyltransferase [Devosia sp.]|uniref:GNAT family N-acetyltransferase n=1 Tax=Devosia sp. TaxID=1871048 RepID=UPI00260C4408|nr:GNAT family N-acetyltransferase [Devosia sp.]MDB5540438.1 N-acetyltransferase [Devosia sp.]
MELRTARLLLRRPVPDDLVPIHAVMSSPEAMRYWSTLPHESLAVTEAWFPGALLSFDNPAWDEWIIEHEGRVVGYMGIWNMPEFGFILHPDVWGRGLATEAATAFIEYAFAAHPIDALTADVDPRNTASLKLLQRLGFTVTGTARNTFLIGGEWYDSVYLSLPRPH